MKRNLLYYVCPIKTNNQWEKNLDMISKYSDRFNNKIIVSIAVSEDNLEPPGKVKDAFRSRFSKKIQFIECKNEYSVAEILPFAKMIKEVKSEDEDEISFYAHAKGVSPRYSMKSKKTQLSNKIAWRNLMYHFCLNDIDEVEAAMKDSVSCGCIKREIKMLGGSQSKWHYAGNFFWFKHKPIFSNKDWNKIRMIRVGVEAYLGENFDKETGHCLFGGDMPFCIVNYSVEKWNDYLSKYNLNFEDLYRGDL